MKRYIWTVLLLLGVASAAAQTDTIRYVKVTGQYTNNGRSWANAKNDVQDAINDLYEYLQEHNLTSGSVYVAAGTYKPSETTESEGGGLQYTAFKIYPGIHVYGGFAANEDDDDANPYEMNAAGTDYKYRPHDYSLPNLEDLPGNTTQEAKSQPWNFQHKTILSGSHNSEPSFTFDQSRGTFSTVFTGNSYHVVWFATSGFIPVTTDGNQKMHALPLSRPASVDGCTITGGNALTKNTTERVHTSYGGGAYLVGNATLSSCVVDHCEATMRGGGVYLDGGGLVDKCFINTCQSPGVGIMQGYGGGACIDYDGAITRSYIVNNSSRIGGGIAICHAPNEYPWQSLDAWRVANGGIARGEINVYSPHATACIISNNTTTAEGGGIYFYDGGVGNHLTITRNKCIGQDITYYGRRHGRSGGVYILNGGQVYNSVIWGNKCPANNDIQYATYTAGSTQDVTDGEGNVVQEGLKPKLFYSAIDEHDITDWSGTQKQKVMSLEQSNTNEHQIEANFPYFIGSDGRGKIMGYAGAGVNINLPMGTIDEDYANGLTSEPNPDATGIPRPIYWKPAAITSMAEQGLQVSDALYLTSRWIQHAHTGTDLFGDEYEPMSTFGALVRRDEQIGYAMVDNQEKLLYADKGYTQAKVDDYNTDILSGAMQKDTLLPLQLPDDGTEDTLPTIFIDPSRNAGKAGITIGDQNIGSTWEKPVKNINDAIHFFRQHLKRSNDGGSSFVYDGKSPIWYDSNGDCRYTIDGTDYKHVQILIKGFELGSTIHATTAGLDAYLGSELRTAAIRPTSNMRIYGGYTESNTGTSATERKVRSNPTIISADITGSGYQNNSAHLLAYINVRNVIVDGIRLNSGNANLNGDHSYAPIDPETGKREAITYGGGIIMNNSTVPQNERIDMTGNIFRNGNIANCSAPEGAAIYVNSSNKKANGEYSKAELNLLNTIVRNNTVGDGSDILQIIDNHGDAGVITARGGKAIIRVDHCDIVNNCGFAFETLVYSDKDITTPSPTEKNADEGHIRVYNSVIYANGKMDRANRKYISLPTNYHSESNSFRNIDGEYLYLDWDAPMANNVAHSYSVLCRDLSAQYHKWGIRKMDADWATIVENGEPMCWYFDTKEEAQNYIDTHPSPGDGTWTWNKIQNPENPSEMIEGPLYLEYPFFENPSKNVGHSAEGDKPMNGGNVSYMPQNKNPMINAACSASTNLWDADNLPRTRGGDPDIGAIEGQYLPAAGAIIYVTPNGAGRRDGSSWDNAIAGNTIYALNGAGAAGTDVLDGARVKNTDGTAITNGAANDNGVLTTDPRYCGGFATSKFTSLKTGGDATTTTSTVYTTETNEYYKNGIKQDAETQVLQDHVMTVETSTTTVGATETSGVQQDPRFPYGEISGQSRTFWRANPYTGKYGTADSLTFINAVRDNGWICNTRTENYVSGLQYAVEKASAYNSLDPSDPARIDGVESVQVWVGNGKYTDYKGFVMRDKATVMGGFPVDAYETPGEDERQALMSAVVNIPKAKRAKDFIPEDYETILQISDINPEGEGHSFNETAVNAWDDDLELTMPNSTTLTTNTVNRTIVHRYDWIENAYNDVTSTYYQHSSFRDNQITDETTDDKGNADTSDDLHTLTFGTATSDKDCWHLTYTGNASTSGSNGVIGRYEQDQMSGKNNYNNNIYENGLAVGKTTRNRPFLRNGSLTGVQLWQDMKNVPAGDYKIVVDLTAYYRSGTSVQANNVPTGVTFIVTNAEGTHIVEEPINAKNKKGTNLNQNLARAELSRYTFVFNQPIDGTLGIRISVGTLDPSKGDNRELSLENFKLYQKDAGYNLTDETQDDHEIESETTHPEATPVVKVTKHRPALRKRVLTMPDVCVPTYGGGGIGDPEIHGNSFNDVLPHTDRVSDAVKDQRTATPYNKYEDPNYVGYTNMFWDGFTIRHGFLYDESMCHGGGAGVNMYEGAHLKNCVVINNYAAAQRMKGGGLFCDGATSTIEGCFVLNNTAMRGSTNVENEYKQVFSGGMFLYEGTCFNSLFAKNYSFGSAGGVGFCVGRFFNNTIAYNDCDLMEGPKNQAQHKNGGAISIATSSNPNLFIANTIIYGNTGMAIRERYDQNININAVNPFINCYVQTAVAFTQNIYKKNINNYSTSGNYGIGNTLLNGVAPSAANTPFAADLNNNGEYTGNAGVNNDFRLTLSNNYCVNQGTEDFTGSLKDVLKRKLSLSDAQVESQFIYQSVSAVQLPSNDVVYADRVQDCQIDIGAYEFDGTQEIKPGYELISFDPETPDTRELCAVYYVSGNGGSGLATAQSHDNAACERKLQHVFDAAGRLKMDLATIKAGITLTDENRYSTKNVNLSGPVTATYEEIYLDGETKEVRLQTVPNNALANVKHVIVKMAAGNFYPIRSTNENMVKGNAEEVLPTRSLSIPHGVEVMGGYLDYGSEHPFYETFRDPLNNKTVFTGQVLDENTGKYGRAYHVVTFTNNIYGIDDLVQVENGLATLTDRAVIDGISIENGYANGTETEEKGGGAAVVTDFSHVRNCIVQDNKATLYGGGLHLNPGALVSGCVMLNNEADYGGAIYAEEPDEDELSGLTEEQRDPLYARILNTTIVRNEANVRGGGLWYETNLRAKGLVLWRNHSNDMNNVAGVFDTQELQNENNYPFAYCAVQDRRLPGVNNIELDPNSQYGVRWTQNSNDDMRWRGDKPTYEAQTNKDAYYYIEKLSMLVRSGMPYQLYRSLHTKFPSLELRDMAGVARMAEQYDKTDVAGTIGYLKHMTLTLEKKNNSFIEIGARALNNQAGSNLTRPFTRLYVASPQFVNNSVATRLMESDDPLYSQQGSSMANPFQKLSDALEYVVALRNSEEKTANNRMLKDIYCDTRFEIFLSGGTYYPYHNPRGIEGHARSSTFVVPEGVTIVGGLDPDVYYCQEGYDFDYLQPMAGDDILNYYGNEHSDIYYSGNSSVSDKPDYRSNARTSFLDESGNAITALSDITLVAATPKQIWESRPLTDINGNNVYEPWEFQFSTTLSGNTPRGVDNMDNVYHVITCFADPMYVGQLPRRYSTYSEDPSYGHVRFGGILDNERGGTEHPTSEMHRTIILSGLTISDGNARDYESESVKNLTQYYRGGGIMVDGSWTDGDGNSTQTDPDELGKRNIPMYLTFSQFLNNNAIQGGAIFTNGSMNIFSCSFVQNYAQGPTANPAKTESDKTMAQGTIQYSGGGAIAANDVLRCCNSIFANNEAMLGDWSDKMGTDAKGWEIQGFGGAIWGGELSQIRLMNCDMVMNQAVSYPAVFVNPAQAETNPEDRFCVNTIFWGNKTTGVPDSHAEFKNQGINDINDDVFSYRSEANKEIELALEEKEEAGTLTSGEAAELTAFREIQPMFFCAYRPGFGPRPVLTPKNPATGKVEVTLSGFTEPWYGIAKINGTYNPHEVPFVGENAQYYDIFNGNNNINITYANEGVNGPNFVLPSTEPGKDGYNPSANWMPSRINNLTDNGWSYLTLTSDTESGDIEFKKIGAGDHNSGGTKPETPMTPPDNIVTGGPYHFYSYQQSLLYKLTLMPFGDQHYMRYKNTNMTDAMTNGESNMLRISSNPLTFDEAKAYIDLGVYEYQHRNLRINQNSEIDVLWVSETENLDKGNDGYTWDTPTSNLQAAIETLLKSRNDHAKQINIIAGEYKPSVVLGDINDLSLSFTIQSHLYNNGAFTPSTGSDYGVRSLTLRGGYDPEIPEETGYDFKKNKVTLSIEQRTSITNDQLNHIVNILDAEQYTTNVNAVTGERTNASRGVAFPITFEGITFNNTLAEGTDPNKNKGGAAIYYRKQTKYVEGSGKGDVLLDPPALIKSQTYTVHNDETDEDEEVTNWIWEWDNALWDNAWDSTPREPKLTLRNCTFTQNGKEVTNPTSAVYIDEGGGSSLIVNSVFDRNVGDPLVAVNTTVLNSTFGLNGGHMKLTETTENGTTYHSALHNSVIWKENQNTWSDGQLSVPTQYSGVTPGSFMTYNAITGLPVTQDAQYNYGLSDTNNDVLKGPNFKDPEDGDFSLNPSKLLMNRGDNDTYANLIWPDYSGNVTVAGKTMTAQEALMQNLHADQSIWETRTTTVRNGDHDETITYQIQKARYDYDRGFTNRLQGTHIDRGAFECTSKGQRVIYVNPNKTNTGIEETGKEWNDAYSAGNLQTAIDAATIYTDTGKKAYVFVKGHRENNALENAVTFRDGVEVYGSIQINENAQAIPINPAAEDWEYTDQEIDAFVNRVKARRHGIATKGTYSTHVKGVTSVEGTSYDQGAVIDGIVVTNGATESAPATVPAVNITVPNVVLRNSIVRGNVMATGQPVINIAGGTGTGENSLLYNTLVYGNTTTNAPVVNVESNGYVLNTTVVSDNEQAPIGGTQNNSTHVKNTLAVTENTSARHGTFAPYLRPDDHGGNTGYSLGNESSNFYLINHQPYWYQLNELSTNINAGEDNGTTAKTGGNTIAALFPNFVNFNQDRDVLGNPRRLGGRVDNGAFETWKVTGEHYASNATNSKGENNLGKYVTDLDSSDPDYESQFNTTTMVPKGDYWTENYGGHRYPHTGSVVYIDENASLCIDTDGDAPLFDDENSFHPGYLLVKEGGSLYGNGNHINLEYVAVDRTVAAKDLMSLPYDYHLEHTFIPGGDDVAGTVTQTTMTTPTAYTYDGAARAAWDYYFEEDDSPCWTALSDTKTDAGEGWLMEIAAGGKIRMTEWGSTSGDYVYTENGTDKTVELTQYDSRTLGTNDYPQFTRQENMGWNLKGLPWLVSDYDTHTVTGATYQMNVPHVIYSTISKGITNESDYRAGQFYTAQSWDTGTTLSLGHGFFTQTAIIGDGETETLTFKIPRKSSSIAPARPQLVLANGDDDTQVFDVLQLQPDEEADASMPYHFGSDGVKWFSLDEQVPQFYAVNGNGAPLSLMASAPVETDIPVNLQVRGKSWVSQGQLQGNSSETPYQRLNIRLPETEPFETYEHVWLTDHKTGSVTDLMEEDYTFMVEDSSEDEISDSPTSRFTLRIGGQKPGIEEQQHDYIIYTSRTHLTIKNLEAGDRIQIFTIGGQLVERTKATESEYYRDLQPGTYIVRVNNYAKKLDARR